MQICEIFSVNNVSFCGSFLITNKEVELWSTFQRHFIYEVVTVVGNNISFDGAKNMAWCKVGENGCRCRLALLQWLQSMSSRTNVASNTMTLYRLSTCLPSCHHQYEVN